MKIRPRQRTLACTIGILASSTLMAGCSKNDSKEKPPVVRQGRVASIDKAKNVFSMFYYNPKTKEEQEVKGTLDPNVEVLINGVVAGVDDVQVGDEIEVTARVTRGETDVNFAVLKVQVTRAVEAVPAPPAPTVESATPPAPSPAPEPAPAPEAAAPAPDTASSN